MDAKFPIQTAVPRITKPLKSFQGSQTKRRHHDFKLRGRLNFRHRQTRFHAIDKEELIDFTETLSTHIKFFFSFLQTTAIKSVKIFKPELATTRRAITIAEDLASKLVDAFRLMFVAVISNLFIYSFISILYTNTFSFCIILKNNGNKII